MSTQVNTYVMYGVLLAKPNHRLIDEQYDLLEPYLDSAFDPEANPKDGITVLFDGMCGKYIAIGYVHAKSREGEGFDAPVTLALPASYEAAAVQNLVLGLGFDLSHIAAQWMVISHYR
jgi:hypothetical protein